MDLIQNSFPPVNYIIMSLVLFYKYGSLWSVFSYILYKKVIWDNVRNLINVKI